MFETIVFNCRMSRAKCQKRANALKEVRGQINLGVEKVKCEPETRPDSNLSVRNGSFLEFILVLIHVCSFLQLHRKHEEQAEASRCVGVEGVSPCSYG